MQIKVDTHSHTVASTHAYSTVHDYFEQAKKKGLELFSITDHAPEMPDSPHPWHFGNMQVLPRIVDGVGMLRGIEGNILPMDGGLDVNERMASFLDFVIASFHEPVFEPTDEKTHTRALINTIETGRCQIVGHPGNPNYPLNYQEVIRAAKDNNVLIEINNSSFSHSRVGSEENCLRILELVDQLDWKVVFSSDAHVAYSVGSVENCVDKAQKSGFPFERVVNRDAQTFLRFLAEHGRELESEFTPILARQS
ncbi:phosphatase [Alteromonas sp. a30]|uniref:phosphatase n=1 Tax=Alteromonas sp. a30 TaxID=2730917 RepID=UPI002283162E|nr:phosphatase [Alteromonas sp. a30]MCY7294702.1 phosphatase [Alteromonas sp. a30]